MNLYIYIYTYIYQRFPVDWLGECGRVLLLGDGLEHADGSRERIHSRH